MLNDTLLMFAVCGALSVVQARTADAQTVPMKGSGSDATYDPTTGHYEGVGNASHLGKFSFAGDIAPDGVFFPEEGVFFAGTFAGTQNFVAANGDVLEADVSGDVVLTIDPETGLVSGTWLATWDITRGTGRFAGASGHLEGAAINPPFDPNVTPWGFNWYFSGELNLAKK
jgi:hypothetical protein